MIILTKEEIIKMHSELILKTGGLDGTRDLGLLESAIESANTTFFNEEKYKSIEEKSARLAYAITSNHPFIDGNKRIGVLTMLMTLRLNEISLNFTSEELVNLGLDIADGSLGYDEIYKWIKKHK